jgi:hypothetical protein
MYGILWVGLLCIGATTCGTVGVSFSGPWTGLTRTVYKFIVYDSVFGQFPAINAVYTPYVYDSGQP